LFVGDVAFHILTVDLIQRLWSLLSAAGDEDRASQARRPGRPQTTGAAHDHVDTITNVVAGVDLYFL